MKSDSFGCLISEQGDYPSNLGDSCAETCRALHMRHWLKAYTIIPFLSYYKFITESGYVRHPNAPHDWREDDFTSDQALPLFVFLKASHSEDLKLQMISRIRENNWKTGNGDLVTPIFFSLLIESKWLLNFCLIIQTLLFKLPFRWSDSKKKFESMENMSGDYLNFIHASAYASPIVRKLISQTKLKDRVRHYYKDEPNCAWLIALYDEFIEKFWPNG